MPQIEDIIKAVRAALRLKSEIVLEPSSVQEGVAVYEATAAINAGLKVLADHIRQLSGPEPLMTAEVAHHAF